MYLSVLKNYLTKILRCNEPICMKQLLQKEHTLCTNNLTFNFFWYILYFISKGLFSMRCFCLIVLFYHSISLHRPKNEPNLMHINKKLHTHCNET